MEQRVLDIVSKIMNVPIGTVSMDSCSRNVDSWDSLKQMKLVLALEEEFDLEFDDDQILKLNSVKTILDALKARAN